MKINLQKLVDIRGYELPPNLKNFTQKDLTEIKNIPKSFRGVIFFETPGSLCSLQLQTQRCVEYYDFNVFNLCSGQALCCGKPVLH